MNTHPRLSRPKRVEKARFDLPPHRPNRGAMVLEGRGSETWPGDTLANRGRAPQLILPDVRIYKLVYQAARAFPSNIAFETEYSKTTYQSLIVSVEQKARFFVSENVKQGDIVAILARRSCQFVETLLALSRVGAIFTVLDSDHPDEHLREQLSLIDYARIVGERDSAARMKVLTSDPSRVLVLPKARRPQLTETAVPAIPDPAFDELAYFLFTSGTTGKPKRVGIGHAPLAHFVQWQSSAFGIGPSDRVTMLSGLCHDPVLRDIFLPLSVGATLLAPDQSLIRAPKALYAWLKNMKPSVIHTTPAMGRLLDEITGHRPALETLRWIFWGGDKLPGALVRSFAMANPGLNQVNFYGATETPQAVSHYICRRDDDYDFIPIGLPVPHVTLELFEGDKRVSEPNTEGEIVVFTPYHVQLSGCRADRLIGNRGQRYATGDRGFRLPDGNLQIIGRKDDQVEIRGYRVELDDIKEHILATRLVKAAIVVCDSNGLGDPVLRAHVVPLAKDRQEADLKSCIHAALTRMLPDYMVPASIFLHDALPMLPNGKIDRQALRRQAKQKVAEKNSENPSEKLDDGEKYIIKIFENIMDEKITNVKTSFSELGADSLTSVRAAIMLEDILAPLPDDWDKRNISELATLLRDKKNKKHFYDIVWMDASFLIRAVSIFLIVAQHYNLFTVNAGSSVSLFMLAGFSLFNYQMENILSHNSPAPLAASIKKVALFTLPIVFAIAVAKIIKGEGVHSAIYLFTINLIDHNDKYRVMHTAIWMWFILSYVEIMAFIWLLLKIPAVRSALRAQMFLSSVGLFAMGCIVKFGAIAVFAPSLLTEGVSYVSGWTSFPTTHLPTVLLGGVLASARQKISHRVIAIILTVMYCLANDRIFVFTNSYFFLMCSMVVLFAIRVPLLRILRSAVMQVSASTLYIYLMHEPMYSLSLLFGNAIPLPLSLFNAIWAPCVVGEQWRRFYEKLGWTH